MYIYICIYICVYIYICIDMFDVYIYICICLSVNLSIVYSTVKNLYEYFGGTRLQSMFLQCEAPQL